MATADSLPLQKPLEQWDEDVSYMTTLAFNTSSSHLTHLQSTTSISLFTSICLFQDVGKWVGTLPPALRTEAENAQLLPADGSLVSQWTAEVGLDASIL